jgi:hypothetical protein
MVRSAAVTARTLPTGDGTDIGRRHRTGDQHGVLHKSRTDGRRRQAVAPKVYCFMMMPRKSSRIASSSGLAGSHQGGFKRLIGQDSATPCPPAPSDAR